MMSRRRSGLELGLAISVLLRDWQFEGKGRALAEALAVDQKPAPHGFGGKGSAVQAKAMSIFAGGEAMVENARQVLGWDADAIIDHGNFDQAVAIGSAQDDPFVGAARFLAGILGVA